MYAIIKAGGKQHTVRRDDIIRVDKIHVPCGETLTLKDVLLVDDGSTPKIGTPFVDGALITAEIVKQTRNNKIIVFKKKRRNGYRRKKGHRQDVTLLKITDIALNAETASSTAQ